MSFSSREFFLKVALNLLIHSHKKKLFAPAIFPAELQWSFFPKIIFPTKAFQQEEHFLTLVKQFANVFLTTWQ
jgi:hypothetical protein